MNETTQVFYPARGRADLALRIPSPSRSQWWKKRLLSRAISQPLDRVHVLGNDLDYGHTGCVNAVSWAQNGELLLTGGDDTTVRMWRADPDQAEHEHPLVCTAVVETGHQSNIFGVQMLPYSTRAATVALDTQVRVFDVGHAPLVRGEQSTLHRTGAASVAVLRCHGASTKRLLLEDSPERFLSVSTDGTVRQHDLRMPPHRCRASARGGRTARGATGEGCPPPLVRLGHDLSAIGGSPLAPHQFVVAGKGPYGYLFDRRQAGRVVEEEWGRAVDAGNLTTCVRRFGRHSRAPGEMQGHEYVTGARMARSNAHEVLLSYSADAVYYYSTLDDAEAPNSKRACSPGVLPPNTKRKRTSAEIETFLPEATSSQDSDDIEVIHMAGVATEEEDDEAWEDEDTVDGSSDDEGDEEGEDMGDPRIVMHGNVPVIFPRARFAGAANVETVKDVNFVGPNDEYVASGSDDGNFFLWKKSTGKLHGIYEGDGSVVNVIEPHPHLPLIATSGIDTTVKLFAPSRGASAFSRLQNADAVIRRNTDPALHSRGRYADIAQLLLEFSLARRASGGVGGEDAEEACVNQ